MNITSMTEILRHHPDVIDIRKLKRPGIAIRDIDKNKKEVVMYNIDYQKDSPYSQKVYISMRDIYYLNTPSSFIQVLDNYIQKVKFNMTKHLGFEPLIFVGEPYNSLMSDSIEIIFTAFEKTKTNSVIKLMEFYD